MGTGLATLDWIVIALYFSGIIFLVWRCSRRQETSTDYFLASRNIAWFVVGASVFASNRQLIQNPQSKIPTSRRRLTK